MKRIVLSTTMIALIFMLCACGDGFNSTSIPARDYQTGTPAGIIEATITPRMIPIPIVFESLALQKLLSEDPHTWYEKGLEIAMECEEQYIGMLKIHEDRVFFGKSDDYTRKIAEILTMIPTNWPRLTVEEVKSVIQELKDEGFFAPNHSFDVYEVRSRLNEIAFAPDFDAVNGVAVIRYFTSEALTEYVEITDGRIVLWDRGANAPKEVLYDWIAEHPDTAATVVLAPTITPTITPRNTPTPMTYSDSSLNELVSQGLDRLYVNSMRVATDEQKRKLCEIHDNRELGYWEEAYERRVAEIMGLIPENWPRVSVSDAKRILQEMIDEELITQEREFPTNLVKERFNEIAFAPDMDGGSGMICVRYYIDSTKTDFIEVSARGVIVRDITSSEPKEVLYDTLPGNPW